MSKRTVRNFVKRLVLKGRTDKQILAVAMNSSWDSSLEEIKNMIDLRAHRWRKGVKNV